MFVGSGILLADVMWLHMGYIDLKVFLVTLQHTSYSHRSAWPINSSTFLWTTYIYFRFQKKKYGH
jgi:hypothetical protein